MMATTETSEDEPPGISEMTHDSVAVEQDWAPKVARYVMGAPFEAAGSHETAMEFVPGTPTTDAGAEGAVGTGITPEVGADAGPVPNGFVAVTTNV